MMELGELLERSEALLVNEGGRRYREGIPKLQRSLAQIELDAQRVFSARGLGGRNPINEAKAIRLLAEHGYEAHKLSRDLRLAGLDAIPDSILEPFLFEDLPTFLEHRFRETTEEARKRAERTTQKFYIKDMNKRLQEELTTARADLWTQFRKVSQQTLIRADGGKGGNAITRVSLDPYCFEVVRQFLIDNDEIEFRVIHLAESLAKAVESIRDPHLVACYEIVSLVTKELSQSSREEGTVRAAKHFLESQFKQRVLSKYPTCDTLSDAVLSFARESSEDSDQYSSINGREVLSDSILWKQVYYLMRCGATAEALVLLEDMGTNWGHFHSFMRSFIENKEILSADTLTKLMQEYSLIVYRGSDTFQKACYLLLAKLDPMGDPYLDNESMGRIAGSVEDFLWFMLSCIRGGNEKLLLPNDLKGHMLVLSELQAHVHRLGARYFDPRGTRTFVYAMVLLLTGQFPKAVAHLAREGESMHTIHLGLPLYQRGLLSLSQIGSSSPSDSEVLDYDLLMDDYVSTLVRVHPAEAAFYAFLIQEEKRRENLLMKILVEVKEVGLFLGRLDANGVKTSNGIYEDLAACVEGRPVDIDSICGKAALEIESTGDPYTALEIYAVQGDVASAIGVLLPRLSIDLTSRAAPARQQTFSLARNFLGQHRNDMDTASAESTSLQRMWQSLEVLGQLGEFFDLFWKNKLSQAWALITALEILPTKEEDLRPRIHDMALGGSERFERVVTTRGAELCSTSLEILRRLCTALRSDSRSEGDERTQERLNSLETSARLLLSFAGMMRYEGEFRFV